MAAISCNVFSNFTISGESWDRIPLAADMVCIQTGRHPSHPGVDIVRQLAEIFDGFFHVVRQRIHLTVHPGEELAGVLKSIFQAANAGGQVRVVGEFSETVQGRFQMLFQPREIQFPKGIGQLFGWWTGRLESRHNPYSLCRVGLEHSRLFDVG